jgi:hypothetical protein
MSDIKAWHQDIDRAGCKENFVAVRAPSPQVAFPYIACQ